MTIFVKNYVLYVVDPEIWKTNCIDQSNVSFWNDFEFLGILANHKTEFETYILDSSRGWTILVQCGHNGFTADVQYFLENIFLWLFWWFLS